jgi:hypothetical protein
LLGVLHPALAPDRRSWVIWSLHLLLLAAVLAGLYWVNLFFDVPRKIPGYRLLAHLWLSLLFLLLYVLTWLGWWFWGLLTAEEGEARFPDIDQAWREAVAALDRAGLALDSLPLFLVLGQAEGEEPALFRATQMPWIVEQVPAAADAPLRLYADREAIYVTCAGASLLGHHARVLALKVAPPAETMPVAAEAGQVGYNWLGSKTLQPEGASPAAQEIRDIAARPGREGREMTEDERRRLRQIERRDRPHWSLLKSPDLVELLTARLTYLCRLIARDRNPYCPVNGILLLIPLAGSDSDQDATDTGELCRRDLTVAIRTFKVRCPVFALLCDLETVPGFREFVTRFSESERRQRVGQRCPLQPDYRQLQAGRQAGDQSPQTELIESLVSWVCSSVVPGWVYKKLETEKRSPEELKTVLQKNASLFFFADEFRERERRLGTLLSRGLETEEVEPLLFGGCYLAGTGPDAKTEQGFVRGVFGRLLEEQDHVSWTESALADDEACRSWARVCYLAVVLLVIGGLGLLAWVFRSWSV